MTATDDRTMWRSRPAGDHGARRRPTMRPAESSHWKDRGACTDHDPELWFSYDKDEQDEAERICMSCPVQRECRAESFVLGHDYGIWGGIEEKLRRRLRKELKRDNRFVGILE